MTKRCCRFLPLALFLLNLCVVGQLLTIEYLDQMGSIEGTHITIARWARENWNDLTWFPLWYGGIPYQNTYPPLFHLIVAAVSALLGITPPHAYHAVTAVFYSLGPVTLYWLALRLCGSRAYSFAAGLFYSLISTSAFLIPAVRVDVGGLWGPRRLQALVQYGEGPHVAGMTLLPLVVLLLSLAFEKRRPVWWLAAAFGLASVPLTNWPAGMALAVAVTAWLLARHEGAWWQNWLKAIGIAACAYAIASPGIPPSTIRAIATNESYASAPLSPPALRMAVVLPVLLVLACALWVFRRFKIPEHLRFSLLFLLPTATLCLAFEWCRVLLVPQAGRYHLEMEMALALAVAFMARGLLRALTPPRRAALACLLLLLSVYPAVKCFKQAGRLVRPIQIESTIEYRAAKWFDRHMQGKRVFVPGSVGFFLNAFTDTPQFAGGFDQGVVNNPLFAAAHYQILSGDNAGVREGEVAVLWLKSFGVDAVAVSGPRSREYYKPFRNPRKFDGILPELWRDGDDVIYRVPRRCSSLAHVIRAADLAPRRPEGGLDVDPLRPYVAALENPAYPVAEMRWRNNHFATISARMEKSQILSVQISFHTGWRATVGGEPRRVYGDHLGQLVVEPGCEGPCTVEIHYKGGI
jgi:hypothetical protein